MTPGSAAELAGLAVGDSILEINGQKADRGFSGRSADVRPGDTLRLRVRNSAGERELHWKLGSRQEIELELTDLDKITPEQKARRAAWLKGESQAPGAAAHDSHHRDARVLGPGASAGGADLFSLDLSYRGHPLPVPRRHGGCFDGRASRRNTGANHRTRPARSQTHLRVHVEPRIQHRSAHHAAADSAPHFGDGEEGAVRLSRCWGRR